MNQRQHDLLSLIACRTKYVENDASRPVTCYWVPKAYAEYVEGLKEPIWVRGAGDAACLKGMARKGWIKAEKLHYSFSVTEEGRLALERHREAVGFYPASK